MDIYNKRFEVSIKGMDTKRLLDYVLNSVQKELSESEFPLRFSIFEIQKGKALIDVSVLRR
jgi:hypothetical protein